MAAALAGSLHLERLPELGIGASVARRDGRGVDAREQRSTVGAGFEQSWRFGARPSGRGPVVVRIDTALTWLGTDARGLHLRDGQGRGVVYGNASWVDARGARRELQPAFERGAILLTVPGEVVDGSVFPAVLDPLVGPELSFGAETPGASFYNSQIDLAATSDGAQYFVAWNDYRRAGQCEIFGTRVGNDGQVRDLGLTVVPRQGPYCPLLSSADFDGKGFVLGFSSDINLGMAKVATDGGVAAPAPVSSGEFPRLARAPSGSLELYKQRGTTDVLRVVHIATDGTLAGDRVLVADTKYAYGDRQPLSRAADLACDSTRCLAVWADGRNDTSDVWAQLLDQDGTPSGAAFPLAQGAGVQIAPRVAFGSGTYLVVWEDTSGSSRDVRGALVTSAGAVQPAFGIATATWSDVRPSVAWDGTQFMVAWINDSNGGSVRAARVDASGAVLDVGGVSVGDGESLPSWFNEQAQLEIASTGQGQTLVVWRNQSGLVVSRRLQGATVLDAVSKRLGDTAPSQSGATLATSAQGQTLVVRGDWVEFPKIQAVTLSDAGVGLEHTLAKSSLLSGVAAATDDQLFWVAFTIDYIAQGIFVGADGVPLAAMPTVLTTAPNHAYSMSTARDGPGFISVWQDDRHAAMPATLFARRSFPDGGLGPEFEISAGVGNKVYGHVATNAQGVSLVTWQNDYNGNSVDGVRVQGTTMLDVPPLHFSNTGLDNIVASDGTDFFVAFREGGDVLGTFVPGTGPYNPGNRFLIAGGAGTQYGPSLAFDGQDWLVGFDSDEDPRGGAYAAVVHRDAGVEPRFVISDVPNETDLSPSFSAVGPGAWRAAWQQFDPTPAVSAMRLHVRSLFTDGRPPPPPDDGGFVELSDGGLIALTDGGFVAPRFISTSNDLGFCGVPYRYGSSHRPEVLGDGPLSFSIAGASGEALPATLKVDSASGEVQWTPSSADVGVHHLVLAVSGPGGSATQAVTVQVECATAPPLRQGCGCGAPPMAPGLLLLALVLRARRAGRADTRTACRRTSCR